VALCRPYARGPYATPASNREIADELVVGVDAVKATLRALFALFGVDDLPQNRKRAALAEAALRGGVVARRDL
jgi:DNA-binding NarL/FixJ family response regulator